MAAAAAFLRRAAELRGEPVRRSERVLAATQASLQAGNYDGKPRPRRQRGRGSQRGRLQLIDGYVELLRSMQASRPASAVWTL